MSSLIESMIDYLNRFEHGTEPYGITVEKIKNSRIFGVTEKEGRCTFFMERHSSLDFYNEFHNGMYSMLTIRKKYVYSKNPVEKIEEVESILSDYNFCLEEELIDVISKQEIIITKHDDCLGYGDILSGEIASASSKEELYEIHTSMWKDHISFLYNNFLDKLYDVCSNNPDVQELKPAIEEYRQKNSAETIFKSLSGTIDRTFRDAHCENACDQ